MAGFLLEIIMINKLKIGIVQCDTIYEDNFVLSKGTIVYITYQLDNIYLAVTDYAVYAHSPNDISKKYYINKDSIKLV